MGLAFDPDALSDVPPQDTQDVMRKIRWLWDHRKEIKHILLSANLNPYCRRRLSNYRIIYSYDAAEDDLIIHLVGTRDEIYNRASKRLS